MEEENQALKEGGAVVGGSFTGSESEKIKELEMEVKVWKEKYNAIKKRKKGKEPEPLPALEPLPISADNSTQILELENKMSFLEGEVAKYKKKAQDGVDLAEKLMAELKKRK